MFADTLLRHNENFASLLRRLLFRGLRFDGRQQILDRLIKRSPVVDQHGAITGYYTDSALALHGFLRAHCSPLRPLRGFDGLKPFLLQVKQQQVITGVIE